MLAVIQCVLFGKRDHRRFRQGIGAEILAGIEGGFRGVEQEDTAGFLFQEDVNRLRCQGLVRKKIEIETAPQSCAVHLADTPLYGIARVGDENVHPAVGLHGVVERSCHGLFIR